MQIRVMSDEERALVQYACPSCGVATLSGIRADLGGEHGLWLLVVCSQPECLRPTLFEIDGRRTDAYALGAVIALVRSGDMKIHAWPHPAQRLSYQPDGVPTDLAMEFQEALTCFGHKLFLGAALTGRRVLEQAVKNRGGTGGSLKARIDSLPTTVLADQLKAHAHEVRLIGNIAAHDGDRMEPDEVEDLLTFAQEVLHHLYVMPAKLAASQQRRAQKGGNAP